MDIKIIRDKHTGRSKGFAYIEMERKEDVIGALSLTGQLLQGQPVMVKMSEAEKNLAWEAAEQHKVQQKQLEADIAAGRLPASAAMAAAMAPPMSAPPLPGMPPLPTAPPPTTGPCRLLVENLHTSISEADLRPIFEPFGQVDYIQIERDAAGQSVGKATIQ